MKIPIYQVDTFTDHFFSGNPAAVCMLSTWLSDDLLQKIASENNLPATVFLVETQDDFLIRWFSPDTEIPLCGHGSLAAAYIIFNQKPQLEKITLHSPTQKLYAQKNENLITLIFPIKSMEVCESNLTLEEGLGVVPEAIYCNDERCVAVLKNAQQLIDLKPEISILRNLKWRAVVVTARGDKTDFVSRTFYPAKTIAEDSVTGASHCLLAPYWSEKLGKNELEAFQASNRGGYLKCSVKDNQVLISGQAVLYMEGTIFL